MNRKARSLLLLTLTLAAASGADALVVIRETLFESSNQSMWQAGGGDWSVETFLGKRWGTYAGTGPAEREIGLDLGITGAWAGIKSSGEVGIVPWARASGGSIDISLPASIQVAMPDAVAANTRFRVATSGNLLPGASISANAPRFQAGVDGLFNIDNRLYAGAYTLIGCGFLDLERCDWGRHVDVNLNGGRFSLLGFDSTEDRPIRVFGLGVPGAEFERQYLIHLPTPQNPTGVQANPLLPQPLTPVVGNIIVHNPEDKSGGIVVGDLLTLSTQQPIVEAKMSITGVIETLMGSPGVLRNELIWQTPWFMPNIKLGWTLADLGVGPVFGVEQDFDLDPNLAVRLTFDKPVTQLEWRQVGSVFDWVAVQRNTTVEIDLGDAAELMFTDGFANLLEIEYLLDDPQFWNRTSATVDPALQLQLACASFTGAGQFCLYDDTYTIEGRGTVGGAYANSWVMGGFNSTTVDMRGLGPTELVPVPPTLLLVGLGLCLLGWWSSGPARASQAAHRAVA